MIDIQLPDGKILENKSSDQTVNWKNNFNNKIKHKSFDCYINWVEETNTYSYWKIKSLSVRDKPVKKYNWDGRSKQYLLSWKDKQLSLWKNSKSQKLIQSTQSINLPYWSFTFERDFKLNSPYYSNDDEDFYPIDNPVRKEKVLKVPYIGWSQWKWYMLSAAKKMLQELFENENYKEWFDMLFQVWRIFGTGNEEFLNISDFIGKELPEKKLKDYLMFEMWVMLDYKSLSCDELQKKEWFLWVRRWRLICLPSFFDAISLEILNPHEKKTRSGTIPIYFEVIAKGQSSNLKFNYVPFDLVGKKNEDIQKEVKQDLVFIWKILERLEKDWIWSKTKYGWGKINFDNWILENLLVPNIK